MSQEVLVKSKARALCIECENKLTAKSVTQLPTAVAPECCKIGTEVMSTKNALL